jgi:hypothetical protein
MTYRGKIKGGVVVLDDAASIPEGTEVNVEPVAKLAEQPSERKPTVGEVLLKFAGIMDDPSLPTDGSTQHDHYIYGTPKR